MNREILLAGIVAITIIGCEKKCKEYTIVEKDDHGRSKVVRIKSGEGCSEEVASNEGKDKKPKDQP